jgi:hypothetical protein
MRTNYPAACGFDISGEDEISELTERTSYEKTGRRAGDFFSSNNSQNTEYGKILFQYVNPDFKVRYAVSSSLQVAISILAELLLMRFSI